MSNSEWTPQRIRALVEAMDWGLQDLADKMHVSYRAVQHWVSPPGTVSYRKPSGATIVLLEELEAQARRRQNPVAR